MASKPGFGIAHDPITQAAENSEFPVICDTCLGENPYLRMRRVSGGKECSICTKPYSGFRWRPGVNARFKTTVICQNCAKVKNVCQTCLFDLEFGLPVQVSLFILFR